LAFGGFPGALIVPEEAAPPSPVSMQAVEADGDGADDYGDHNAEAEQNDYGAKHGRLDG
jgi:hypothetical protein